MYQNRTRGAFGISSFCKAAVASVEEDWSADIALIGIPFDEAVTYRPGTRFGPNAIREASLRYAFLGGDTPGYWDMRTERWRIQKRVVDLGDVDIVPLDHEQSYRNITRSLRNIIEHGAFPVTLGGDHSITFPVIKAYEGSAPFTLIHFDAHTDYREQIGGQRIGHAQVIRRACELPWVKRVVSLGIRAVRTDPKDLKAMMDRGNTVLTSHDVGCLGVDVIAKNYLPKDERIYVTFDIDSMDPSIAPGTGTTESGGLLYEQARGLLSYLAENNDVIGFDMVEVNPMLDHSQVTSLLAAQLIVDFLGFIYPGEHESVGRLAQLNKAGT